jgi:hypothetical protein
MKRSKETKKNKKKVVQLHRSNFLVKGDLVRYSNEETNTKEACNFNIDAKILDSVYNLCGFHKGLYENNDCTQS